MSWSSRSFISRIFCIFTFFRDYSLHLLALKSHSCLRILLSLQSSHEVVACSPTALVSLGLEVSYMFSLFLIANPKCPFFHNVKRLYHPQLFCMQAFPSHPSCFEDFSSWIDPVSPYLNKLACRRLPVLSPEFFMWPIRFYCFPLSHNSLATLVSFQCFKCTSSFLPRGLHFRLSSSG